MDETDTADWRGSGPQRRRRCFQFDCPTFVPAHRCGAGVGGGCSGAAAFSVAAAPGLRGIAGATAE